MEELQRLERVQWAADFVAAPHRGLSSSDGDEDSDRFLAELLLLMVQRCGNLSMGKKCALISEFVKGLTDNCLEEVQHIANNKEHESGFNWRNLHLDHGSMLEADKEKLQLVPFIGLDAMQRANSTIEDFCRSYFLFHDMDCNNSKQIFMYLPILSFTESYIYQLDTENESNLRMLAGNSPFPANRHEDAGTVLYESPSHHSFDRFISLLQCQGLISDRIEMELKSGIEYWFLEQKLCHALASKEQVNELHMEFLSISELLVEISDDLYDYEDDVMNNTFNILRMFVACYGAPLAPKMLAKYIGEAEEKYEILSKKLDPNLSFGYWRRCEEATKEGGVCSGHPYGTWTIPPIIVDEELFRSQCSN